MPKKRPVWAALSIGLYMEKSCSRGRKMLDYPKSTGEKGLKHQGR
jgi:hypothetical protein